MKSFSPAKWSIELKTITAISLLSMLLPVLIISKTVPHVMGNTFILIFTTIIPITIIAFTASHIIIKYEIDNTQILIQRLTSSKSITISDIKSINIINQAILRGSYRIFGIGGLFTFSGKYKNKELGTYNMFATNLKSPVVITMKEKENIIITPKNPVEFIQCVNEILLTGQLT